MFFKPVILATCAYLFAAAGDPSPLTGRWTNGRISMIQYKDAYTGVYKPPSGSHFAYEFRNDGTYTFIGLMQSTVYNCTTSVFSQETGTYESNGLEVTLHPQKNPYQMRYSCSPNSNKEAPGKLIERTYKFRVAGSKLELLTAGSTEPQTFQRSTD
ncbi:hypothetical protein F183_A54430 [Bryobacterales bacterium F-183]|nr:hypothetical protein F183_A54430 [Bryobacterales bacterium F-183]